MGVDGALTSAQLTAMTADRLRTHVRPHCLLRVDNDSDGARASDGAGAGAGAGACAGARAGAGAGADGEEEIGRVPFNLEEMDRNRDARTQIS